MKFFFVLAGVPQEIFDEVRKQRAFVAGGDNTKVELVHHGRYGTPYTAGEVEKILTSFVPHLQAEANDDLGQTAFAVFYVSNGDSDRLLEEGLFPFLFTVRIEWQLSGYEKHDLSASKNALVRPLRALAAHTRACMQALGKELVEQSQRTPWLLPVRNFESDHLRPAIQGLMADLLASTSPCDVLARRNQEFKHQHPPQRTQDGHHAGRYYFVDGSGMCFKPRNTQRRPLIAARIGGGP